MDPHYRDFADILRCPTCGGELSEAATSLECCTCGVTYPESDGQIDLRLQEPVSKSVEWTFDGEYLEAEDFEFGLPKASDPAVDWSAYEVPRHLDDALLSHFPKAESPDARVLDVGCGAGDHEEVCRHAGYEWVGLDSRSEAAPILGDVHSLPFEDSTFDFALSVAVLSLVSNPFVALQEIERVLTPGSKFLGTVAFLEPLHGNSHYHHSPLGVVNSLREAGFRVEYVGPGWHSLRALGRGLFPKLPRSVVSLGAYPVEVAHRLWYAVGRWYTDKYRVSKQFQAVGLAGSFRFVAVAE